MHNVRMLKMQNIVSVDEKKIAENLMLHLNLRFHYPNPVLLPKLE